MVVIPYGRSHKIQNEDAAWVLYELRAVKGKPSWCVLGNMRSLPDMMARIAQRNIEATPDEIATAQQMVDAWERQLKRFTETMERHAPAQKLIDELDDLRRENAELRAAIKAQSRTKKEKA